MRGSNKILALVVVCFAAAVAVWGLGRTASPVAAAATKSADAGGANFTVTATATPSSGQPVTVTASGEFDGQQGDLTTDLSGALAAAGAPAGASGQVEVRYLQENGDPVVYVNAPALSAMIPGGASWVRVDLQQFGQTAGVDLNQILGQAASQTPGNALDMLQSVSTVRSLGNETINNGVSTTHYQASIDPTKVAAQIPGALGQRIQNALANAPTAPSSIPVDVWIGDDGLVYRVVYDASSQDGSVHVQLDLSGYGTSVTVSAPPSGQVFDATSLLSGLASGLGQGSSGPSSTVPGVS
jgi:hypothetical protein